MNANSITALLIEDNPADARLIKEMLKESASADFRLEWFDRLSKGIEYLKDHSVDVVLLDLTLPDSTGIETFEKLYKHTPYLPIIVLTGVNDEQMAIESLHSGLQDYLVKNKVDGDLLTRSIRYAIERKRLENALRTANDHLEIRVKHRTLELSDANKALHEEITERKKAEAALRESEERLNYSLNAADLGAWDLNMVNQTTYRSLKHDQIFGYKTPVPQWNLEILLDHMLPEDRTEVERKFEKAVSDHEDWNFECRIRREDGEVRWIWKQGRCKYDENGKAIRMAGVIQDITERKRVEEELKESKVQAELYLDLMGHDISNMHQIIMGQLELAKEIMDTDRKLDAIDKQLIDTSLDTLERSARLIDNVRKIQKLNHGEFNEEIINLNSLLPDIINEYNNIVPDKSIKFVGFGSHCVKANRLLRDVFTNLINNSIKHTNGNIIDITIKLESARENGKDYSIVMVEDNGPGITDDMKERVFNRLQRGKTNARGIGLGLYIVKTLVESFGGFVKVDDRVPGEHTKGAKFLVYLPIIEV